MDWRVLIVFGPVLLAVSWAAFNIIKAAVNGEAKLFGDQGNIPWQDK